MNENIQQNLFVASVDPVIFSLMDEDLFVLLVRRKSETFDNFLSLPGGTLNHEDQNLENGIIRVLDEKTGVNANYMEQIYTRVGHDPRGPTISVAYMALVHKQDVKDKAFWVNVKDIEHISLAFDHKEVIEKGIKRLTDKVNYSTLPIHFLEQPFTLPKLQKIYETLLNEKLSKSSFRAKIEETGILEDIGQKVKEGPYRPASLYKLKENKVFNFSKNMIR
jgi:8-oxo-dGTP diphosphatase